MIRPPVVIHRRPAADGIFNGTAAVFGKADVRRRIGQHIRCGGHRLHTGGLHRLGRRVVGRRNGAHHPPAAQRGIVDDAGGGQLLVGLHDDLPVIGFDFCVIQCDLPHGAFRAGGFDHIADAERPGGQNNQPAGHIAQNILCRKCDTQCQHRHDRRQGCGIYPQRLRRNDDCQHIEDSLDGGKNDLLQPVIDAAGTAHQLRHQFHQQPHHHKAYQQRHNGGQDIAETVAAQRSFQYVGDITHGDRFLLPNEFIFLSV